MKYILIFSLLAFSIGFAPVNEDSFVEHSIMFYTQMFEDGEQSEQVHLLYEDMIHIFKRYSDTELYQELELMYHALGTKGVPATPHQLKVMRIFDDMSL